MRKSLSLLLALLLCVGLLASCGDGQTANPTATPAPSAANSEATPSSAPEEPVFTWPLAEPTTFRIWNGPMSTTANMTTPNDSFAYQEAEKRTNIHIEWDQPAAGQQNEQFLLIVASENYPDAFFGGSYIGGLDKFIDDGVIVDLRDIVEKYAPNWKAMASVDEVTWKKNVTDSGRVPGFYNISYEVEPTWWGPQMREDYLKEFGMASPVTYDDWYGYLTMAKAKKGTARGYMLRGVNGCDDNLLAGFDLIAGFFAKDGTVQFGQYDVAFLDYLTMLNKWYSEGLIDPDYTARATSYFGDMALIVNNEVSAWHSFFTMFDIHKMQAADKTFQGVAVAPPVRTAGQTRKLTIFSTPDSRVGTNIDTISTQCKDPVTLVRWFDYFYSDEGELLADYGVEGQGYTMVNGKPQYTDLVMKNPDGISQNDAMSLYTIGSFHSRQYDWARSYQGRSEYCTNAGKIWDANLDMNSGYASMLGVTLSETESAEYTPLINDINTYVTEAVVTFINGTKPLSEFDGYREQLKAMGIERCIEIYQAAYERYMAR